MARPTIFDRPMTATERSRRSRGAKNTGEQLKNPLTVKAISKAYNISERCIYYGKKLNRLGVPEWEALIFQDDQKIRPSIYFALKVARHFNDDGQNYIIKLIREVGVNQVKRDWNHLAAELSMNGFSRHL
jgi:hypothetical protein